MLALPCFKTPVPSQAGPQSVREMRRMRAITDDDDDDNGVCYALIYGVQWGRDPISAPFFFFPSLLLLYGVHVGNSFCLNLSKRRNIEKNTKRPLLRNTQTMSLQHTYVHSRTGTTQTNMHTKSITTIPAAAAFSPFPSVASGG